MSSCAICAATMEDKTCPCCGWEDNGVVNMSIAWLFIHMSLLLLAITHIESILA